MHSLVLKKVREILKEQIKRNLKTVVSRLSWGHSQLGYLEPGNKAFGSLNMVGWDWYLPLKLGPWKGCARRGEGRWENSLPPRQVTWALCSRYLLRVGMSCTEFLTPESSLYRLALKFILPTSSKKPQSKKVTQTLVPGWCSRSKCKTSLAGHTRPISHDGGGSSELQSPQLWTENIVKPVCNVAKVLIRIRPPKT